MVDAVDLRVKSGFRTSWVSPPVASATSSSYCSPLSNLAEVSAVRGFDVYVYMYMCAGVEAEERPCSPDSYIM